MDDDKILPNFRMKEFELPQVDEYVIMEVVSLNNSGVNCILLEYDNIEAYLSINEWSRKRVKSGNYTRIGAKHVVQVIRVEEEKKYIDEFCTIHNILQRVSSVCGISMYSLYNIVIWPFSKEHENCYKMIAKCAKNPEILSLYLNQLEKEEGELGKKAGQELLKIIKHRLISQPVRIVGKIKIMYHGIEGIDLIKESLIEGRNTCQTTEYPLTLLVESCPIYTISTKSENEVGAKEAILKCMKSIEDIILHKQGIFEIVENPQVIVK